MSDATTYNVELRDKDGNLKTYLTPFADSPSWEWNRIGGCGRAKTVINKPYRDIEFSARDDIQIRVKDSKKNALNFNGSSDYVDCNSTFQSIFRNSFTVSLWVKLDDGIPALTNAFFGVDDPTGDDSRVMFYCATTGQLRSIYESEGNGKAASTASAVFTNGQQGWHHVVWVAVSDTQGYLYFDRELQTLDVTSDGDYSAITFASFTSALNPSIGCENGDGTPHFFTAGNIKDVQIYSQALTADNIEDLYRGVSIDVTPTVHYDFSDGGGSILTDIEGVSNGTIVGADWINIPASKLVYRGWVAKPKPTLAIPQTIPLDIRGYFDLLKKITVQENASKKTYENQSISDIVNDLIDTFVVSSTPITKGIIDSSIYTPDKLVFKTSVAEALRTLADLEGEIEYGVDENLVFFWRKQDNTLRKKFLVGVDISKFNRDVEWDKLVNRIYFEGGDVDGIKLEIVASAQDSIDTFFLSEKIETNSSIVTNSVASQFLSELLRKSSGPQMRVKGSIVNTNIRLEDIIPLGKIAIQDNDYDQAIFIWGTDANGGSDLIWGVSANGGSDKIWGGLFSDQLDTIKYTLSDQDDRFNVDLSFSASTVETSVMMKRLELELEQLRQAR